MQGDYQGAKQLAQRLSDIFGPEHFYLELQEHGIPVQKEVNAQIIRIARETGLPLVATNDVHYINQEDAAVPVSYTHLGQRGQHGGMHRWKTGS